MCRPRAYNLKDTCSFSLVPEVKGKKAGELIEVPGLLYFNGEKFGLQCNTDEEGVLVCQKIVFKKTNPLKFFDPVDLHAYNVELSSSVEGSETDKRSFLSASYSAVILGSHVFGDLRLPQAKKQATLHVKFSLHEEDCAHLEPLVMIFKAK